MPELTQRHIDRCTDHTKKSSSKRNTVVDSGSVLRNNRDMNNLDTIRSFVDSVGGQASAGRLLGRSRATINRIYHGQSRVTVELARRIQQASGNKYSAADILGIGADVYIQNI
jgi:plasmid maintenance system antidote protein VapI